MIRRGLLLLTIASVVPAPLLAQSVEDRARAAAEAARAKTSDSEALQQNYVKPGLAGEAISTVDNSRSFNPNLACQNTATLLELLAQPGSTGDVATLRISRDKDLDGALDQTFNLPIPVSGICANGVIACQPGTWNQCNSYKWDVSAAGDLKLTEVDLTELGGCYCVNNSCGSNLVLGNMASVLKDLGGGVIGALTSADPRIGVAQAVIDGPVIRYTGAQTTACAPNPAVAQTVYRSNPTQIQGDAASVAASNSVFQALEGSPAGMGKAQQIRACTVTREVTLNAVAAADVLSHLGGAYAVFAPSPDRLTLQMGSPRDDSLRGGSCRLFDFQMRVRVDDPDRVTQFLLSHAYFDDWIQLRIDGELVLSNPANWTTSSLPPGKCERGRTWHIYPNLDLKPWLTRGEHVISLRVAVGGEGELFAQFDAVLDTSCNPGERIVDLCAGYAAEPNCQLHDENVDGVDIFRNGIGTGLTPLPQTRLFESGACSLSLTRPWFQRNRRYRCTIDTGTMPEIDLSRGAYIIDHSTETLLADRVKSSDGSYTTSSRAFALPDRGSVAACEPICKTRAPKPNTGVAPDGVVGSRQNAPSGWDTFYHACKLDSAGAATCPVGDGEELVSACGCLDDFPEAVVMMQTVRLGGADMICTSESR